MVDILEKSNMLKAGDYIVVHDGSGNFGLVKKKIWTRARILYDGVVDVVSER